MTRETVVAMDGFMRDLLELRLDEGKPSSGGGTHHHAGLRHRGWAGDRSDEREELARLGDPDADAHVAPTTCRPCEPG